MSGFELLKGVRDLDAALDDYRPKKCREKQFESGRPQNGFHLAPLSPPMNYANLNLRGQDGERIACRLDEIAKAIRTLTYGEMLQLAESMCKVNLHGSEITESDLPGVLHRWSASQR